MHTEKGKIPGLLIIEPKVFGDHRGFLIEAFQAKRYAASGIILPFVQDNLSRSIKNTLRGLHLQNPNAQRKLVTVLSGSILDVAVDVRIGSPTFGRHVTVELDDLNRRQLWLPRGLAHGFIVRSESADVLYKADEFYSSGDEIVIRWDDPQLAIDWGCAAPILSARDREGRDLRQLENRLPYFEMS